MKSKIESPLTETVFLILLAMVQPMHGYGVQKFVEEKTGGRVRFGPGTLYGAINTLEKKAWIQQLPVDRGERKKEYRITEIGLVNLEYERLRMQEVLRIAQEHLEGD